MSALSRLELELVHNELVIERIFDSLVKGCWVEEGDFKCIVSAQCIEFNGGFHESYFKITITNDTLQIESDSPWELEVLTEELKEIAVKKQALMK
jgi:hypothetical protein